MPTRFNSTSKPRFNIPGLPSGYEGKSAPTDLTVPSVGLEDVDRALFNLLDKEIPFAAETAQGTTKVPVIFATAEKWAMMKRQRALRDRNNTLILPLITAVRTTVQQAFAEDITGRGVNQQTGELLVHRRLDNSDRGYQELINRLLLPHQLNLAVGAGHQDAGQLSTSGSIGDLSSDPVVQDGGLLVSDRTNNVYETLAIPSPQYFTALYDITFWAQYIQQMNHMIEQLMSSFLPQGNAWRLDTEKGYWFVGTVVDNTYNSDNNFDDMAQQERVIKYKFSVRVLGYVLASDVPGMPVAIKRYVSSPSVSFDIGLGPNEGFDADTVEEPFLGADDPTLPMADGQVRRRDQRDTSGTRLYPNVADVNPDDPALSTLKRGQQTSKFKKVTGVDNKGRRVTRLVRVASSNRATGETVFSPDADLGGLTIEVVEDQ